MVPRLPRTPSGIDQKAYEPSVLSHQRKSKMPAQSYRAYG